MSRLHPRMSYKNHGFLFFTIILSSIFTNVSFVDAAVDNHPIKNEFAMMKCPIDVLKLLHECYDTNNVDENEKLRGDLCSLKEELSSSLAPIIEEFARGGMHISHYKIRRCTIGVKGLHHPSAIVSAIVNLNQDVTEPFFLSLQTDNSSEVQKIGMLPGDMMLYINHDVTVSIPPRFGEEKCVNAYLYFMPKPNKTWILSVTTAMFGQMKRSFLLTLDQLRRYLTQQLFDYLVSGQFYNHRHQHEKKAPQDVNEIVDEKSSAHANVNPAMPEGYINYITKISHSTGESDMLVRCSLLQIS